MEPREPGTEVEDAASRVFRIYGRVQGVGFRWWTRSLATRLGLSGSVANLADGSVEIHARGPEGALEQMQRELRTGPAGAAVARVEARDEPVSPANGFVIRH